MSKISKDGYEQIQVIRNALDSMFTKLDKKVYVKNEGKVKNIEEQYESTNIFHTVQEEFEAIAGIVELSGTWAEVE